MTFADARKLAVAFENVKEVSSYGTPGFKTGGKLFARWRPDIDALVVLVEKEDREEMMAADPETYFITDHYLDYPWILVRMSRVHPDALRDLLGGAWKLARRKPG